VLEPPVLVVGLGNDLLGDDAVGPLVAETVASWHRPGVEAVAVRQLLPELAAELGQFATVVFVDADCSPRAAVELMPLAAADAPSSLGHVMTPAHLLALARALGLPAPFAWLLPVPATGFGPGDGPSDGARRGMARALDRLAALLPR
jgi:hydrogenase maturation protease